MRGHCFPSEVVSGESNQGITEAAKGRGGFCTCCHSGAPTISVPGTLAPPPRYSRPCLKEPFPTGGPYSLRAPLGCPRSKARCWEWISALADLLRNAPSSDSAMPCTRRCSDSLTRLLTRMFSSRIYRQEWAAISRVPVLPSSPFPMGAAQLPTTSHSPAARWLALVSGKSQMGLCQAPAPGPTQLLPHPVLSAATAPHLPGGRDEGQQDIAGH